MNVMRLIDADHAEPRVVALAHPSLDRLVARFSAQLVQERSDDGSIAGSVSTAAGEVLAPRTLRIGLVVGDRLISMATVDPNGTAAIATLEPWRGSGVDRQLLAVAIERSLTLADLVPVFCGERLDPSLVALALSCGAQVTGRAPMRHLTAV